MIKTLYIGLMSGTSLDGLDICAVSFFDDSFTIHATQFCEFDIKLRSRLQNAYTMGAMEFQQLHVDYGVYCGERVLDFITENNIKPSYIASHGQTIFHTPQTGLTCQIGSGAHIAAVTGISTICDFRMLDVANKGQGAPLVPIGDELLFSEYDYCLNIGGFANVSTHTDKRIAWDICPTNIVLNEYAKKYGKLYDANGDISRTGNICAPLLHDLNSLAFYKQTAPKSLGREWVDTYILPILNSYTISHQDAMRTLCEHMGMQIGNTLVGKNTKTLCTGGGVYNSLLIECITKYAESTLIIPDNTIVNFKEALLFAYLGYLRVEGKPNSLSSVTGATKNVCGGVIWEV